LGFEIRDARLQDLKNRQNSVELDVESDGHAIIAGTWRNKQEQLINLTKETYNWAIQNGIAKEQARSVLPEGNTSSRMYMNGTLRSWVHYIQLRSGVETQKEHREIALACAEAIKPIFPMIEEFISE
jgi:thymidylate synthase (FAD)